VRGVSDWLERFTVLLRIGDKSMKFADSSAIADQSSIALIDLGDNRRLRKLRFTLLR
jgi:hypothetical protein